MAGTPSVVPPAAVALLRQELAALSDEALQARVEAFVLRGEDAAVLRVLLGVPGAGKALKLVCLGGKPTPDSPRKALLQAGVSDPGVWWRLGQVYEAAVGGQKAKLAGSDQLGIPEWLEILLQEAAAGGPEALAQAFDAALIEAMLTAAGEPPHAFLVAFLWTNYEVSIGSSLTSLSGLADYIRRHAGVLAGLVPEISADRRSHAAYVWYHAALAVGSPELLTVVLDELLTDDSVSVLGLADDSQQAQKRELLVPLLPERVRAGPEERRMLAIAALATLARETALPLFREVLATETSPLVRQHLAEWLEAPTITCENRAGLSPEALKWLALDVGRLAAADPALPEAVLRYLVDGTNADVLLRLAGHEGGQLLRLHASKHYSRWQDPSPQFRGRFFAAAPAAPGAVYMRLGKVFEAALRKEKGPKWTALKGHPDQAWFVVLLEECAEVQYHARDSAPVSFTTLHRALEAEQAPPDLLVHLMLGEGPEWDPSIRSGYLVQESAAGEFLRGQRAVVAAVLTDPKAEAMVPSRLEAMKRAGIKAADFPEQFIALAVAKSKKVREAVGPLVSELGAAAVPQLREHAVHGDSDAREQALRLLGRVGGPGVHEFLEQRLAAEGRSAKLRGLIAELLKATAAVPPPAASIPALALPLPPVFDLTSPPSEAVVGLLREAVRSYNHVAAEQEKAPRRYGEPPELIADATLDQAVAWLGTLTAADRRGEGGEPPLAMSAYAPVPNVATALGKVYACPELLPAQFIRLLVLNGYLGPGRDGKAFSLNWGATLAFRQFRKSHPLDLRAIGALLAALGFPGDLVGRVMVSRRGFVRMSPAETWPYFVEHLEVLEEGLGLRDAAWVGTYTRDDIRERCYGILAMMPVIPPQFLALLWEVALGTGKTERPLAQACLAKAPDRDERIIRALGDRKQEVRAVAAAWLAQLGVSAAIPALKAALAKEANDLARGAMLLALERLGESVECYVDRQELAQTAAAAAKKPLPANLGWFPFDALPAVHWEDSGAEVPPAVVQHLLVNSCALKNPEPGPVLWRYCRMMKTPERQNLGLFVVQTWMAHDTIPKYTAIEAKAEAEKQRPQLARYLKKAEELEAAVREHEQELARQMAGSAINERGLLAVTGAAGGASVVPPIERYLKEWFGYRLAQCKALLHVLAWVDHPLALQVLLSVANRFRTKGLQEEARILCEAIAERHGWTVDELADRTIPDAGLEQGVLTLNYGPRAFTARLDEQLEFRLSGPDGQAVKALPNPLKSDDQELAKAAKKRFSDAKKELAAVVRLQRDRLYEAMCTQRAWPAADWQTYLCQHPIVGRLCQRLVWAAFRGDGLATSFRPQADGTLADVAVQPVTLDADLRVRLAHECNLPREMAAAWHQHLTQTKVEPLFVQFGRGVYQLPAAAQDDTAIRDFEGHMLDTFTLRSVATKLGYTRGTPQDAGIFMDYRKRFPGLKLEAAIGFTGNCVPEENVPCALLTLSFVGMGGAADDEESEAGELLLKEVPPVLLGECWHDVQQIAQAGRGFDPNWEHECPWR